MAQTTWALDPTHSEIGFKVKHMMFTNVSGRFISYAVTIEEEENKFETAKISFSADVTSVDTNNADRDNHLRSADFFDVDKFPKLTFHGKSIKKINDGLFNITGDLTIKGVTNSVSLEAEYSGLMEDPWGNTKMGLSLTGKINRKDFGLTYNATLEAGGVLIGEEVKLACELQLIKQ